MPQGVEDPSPVASAADKGAATPKDPKKIAQEQALVRKHFKVYDAAREFDKPFRKQVAIDRKYAAGTSNLTWAVDTNIIGAYIDILVALLYARDPDVSVRKAPQVDEDGTVQMEQFARTLEIVVSQLWKKGKLKRNARKAVRSVLSTGEGWLKVTMVAEKDPQPEVETALNDAAETMELLEGQKRMLADPDAQGDPDLIDAEIAEKQALLNELHEKLEVAIAKFLVIDFVPVERMQVSLDVQCVEDYLDANWCGNEIYVEVDEAIAMFPDLEPEDIRGAKQYYMQEPRTLVNRDTDAIMPQGQITATDAQAFSESREGSNNGPAFVRVIESWDRRDKLIRTVIDGVKDWAKEPYPPPYPTQRFYPYFYFSFFEVDGQRHPQSLSWRMYKLQDEFACTRSNYRVTRERSIPAVLFNASQLEDDQAERIAKSTQQEYIAVKPTDPDTAIGNIFAAKPVATIDMRLYDTSAILADMERVSGVQEALSAAASSGQPKTATEASIQQTGTNARTTSDRDNLEWMLADMATATAQQALQVLKIRDVQRMCGTKAFWPQGMDIEDLFTLVEINIEAGSTGKPRQSTDAAAWATIMPLIRETMGQIVEARGAGNIPLANALCELVKETALRMGDTTDVSRFIPQVPPPGSPGAGVKPTPPPADIKISLTGVLSPEAAQALALPTITADNPNPPAPTGGPTPGGNTPPSPGPMAAPPVGAGALQPGA